MPELLLVNVVIETLQEPCEARVSACWAPPEERPMESENERKVWAGHITVPV